MLKYYNSYFVLLIFVLYAPCSILLLSTKYNKYSFKAQIHLFWLYTPI